MYLKHQVKLTLPLSSPIKDTICGDVMKTKELAKKSAAMKTCIKLYEIGELTEDLRPKKIDDILENLECLFPCMRYEEKENGCIPGTTNKKRRHLIEVSCSYLFIFKKLL